MRKTSDDVVGGETDRKRLPGITWLYPQEAGITIKKGARSIVTRDS